MTALHRCFPGLPAALAFGFLSLCAAPCFPQGCCTPGSSPLGGLSGGPLHRGQFEIGVAAEGFGLRQGYDGSTRIQDPSGRRSRVLAAAVFVRLGLLDRVAFIGQLPFEYRERTAPAVPEVGFPGHDFSNAAVGDLSTIVLVRVLPLRGIGRLALNVGAGIKWATGPYDNAQDGLTLPVELQVGTGSTDPLFALVAYRLWSWGSVSSNAVLRLPTRGENGYRYGEEVNYTLSALGSFGASWQLGLEIRGRSAGRDDFRGFVRENTGGTRVMLGPRVVCSFSSLPMVVEAAFYLPVYQHMNGVQLGVSEGGSMGVRWSVP